HLLESDCQKPRLPLCSGRHHGARFLDCHYCHYIYPFGRHVAYLASTETECHYNFGKRQGWCSQLRFPNKRDKGTPPDSGLELSCISHCRSYVTIRSSHSGPHQMTREICSCEQLISAFGTIDQIGDVISPEFDGLATTRSYGSGFPAMQSGNPIPRER